MRHRTEKKSLMVNTLDLIGVDPTHFSRMTLTDNMLQYGRKAQRTLHACLFAAFPSTRGEDATKDADREGSKMRLRVGAATDTGRVRDLNEDAHMVSAEQGLFVICDGMGGCPAGEVASQMAVEANLERQRETAQP